MDKNEDEEKLKSQVSDLCRDIEIKAKNIIHYKLPQKILLLEDMYKVSNPIFFIKYSQPGNN